MGRMWDDVLNGGYNTDPNDGDDYLDGGAGNDYIKGWIGKNTYVGGAGNDANTLLREETTPSLTMMTPQPLIW